MPKTPTAKELLSIVLDAGCLMHPIDYARLESAEGRREFALQNIEHIFGCRHESTADADGVLSHILTQFCYDEIGSDNSVRLRRQFGEDFASQELSTQERRLAEALVDMSRLSLYVVCEHRFDLALLGLASPAERPELSDRDYFSIRNGQLAGFLQETPFRHLAARVARCMLKERISQAMDDGCEVMQDFLSDKEFRLNGGPEATVAIMLLLSQADRYDRTAADRYGMQTEQRRIYDMLVDHIREGFDLELVGIAAALHEVSGQPAESPREYQDRFMRTAERLMSEHDCHLSETSVGYLTTYLKCKTHDRFGKNT